MISWSLQFLTSLLFLGIGLLGNRIAGAGAGAEPLHLRSWRLTGLALTIHGLNFLVQNLWGLMAIQAGVGSGAMDSYLLAAPAFNHSRTFLLFAYCILLLLIAAGRPWFVSALKTWTASLLLGGLVFGVVVGLAESGLLARVHYAAVAKWDAVELLLLLGTLFYVLLRNSMDRFNWGILAIYGFMLALNVVWLAALAFIETPDTWSPSPRYVHVYRTTLLLLMLALTARRYLLARRRVRVGGLMDTGSTPTRLGLN
jgi:hypothetical protein